MTTSITLALLGFGLGALIIADRRGDPRATLREDVINAQRMADLAAQHARELAAQYARELAAQWSAKETR